MKFIKDVPLSPILSNLFINDAWNKTVINIIFVLEIKTKKKKKKKKKKKYKKKKKKKKKKTLINE